MVRSDGSGHEHHAIAIPASQVGQVFEDFFGVEDGADDKLQLVLTFGHQRFDDLRGISQCFVFANPGFGGVAHGAGVAQFGADRPQVARQLSVDGSGRFDRDVFAALFELFAQFGQGIEDHGFATGDDSVFDSKVLDLAEDFRNAEAVSFGFPGCVAGIAEPAAQIASAGSYENARCPGQETFSLNTLKNLGNPDQSTAF